MKRDMSVAGSFYPAQKEEIENYFDYFSKLYEENFSLPEIKSKAVIVPHAGYIYSGYSANIAYRILENNPDIKNLVIIGPSHKVAFEGVSLCEFDSYDTPFGEITQAQTLMQEIKSEFDLKCIQSAHTEHSTEVQFPFIKHYLEDINIVELVYSQANSNDISKIIDFILQKEDCGVVISTDLSHFYSLEDANKLDSICLKAIDELNIDYLYNGCEACGFIGVEAMLKSAIKLNLKSKILDYRTSADVSKDIDRVVGYVSACFY